MKLLVISQYYDPEPFRIHDLCVGLTELGHEVRVVTGMPNYPQGELYPGFSDNRPVEELKDMTDYYYRCHWATVERRLRPEVSAGKLDEEVVQERRRGLDWLFAPEDDWFDISLDT